MTPNVILAGAMDCHGLSWTVMVLMLELKPNASRNAGCFWRLNMSELSFRWDSPGAWCGIRFPLPVSFVLPDDLKSDSKSICTVHHHLRLWHAHFLVAEHRHHWHYDGRVSGEH